jgi:hypothetical protein
LLGSIILSIKLLAFLTLNKSVIIAAILVI